MRRGYLARSASKDDRRRAVLTLTSRGRLLVRLRSGTVESAVRASRAGDFARAGRILEVPA